MVETSHSSNSSTTTTAAGGNPGGVGDVHCCGLITGGHAKAPPDHLRARKVGQLFGKYDSAALLEDGNVFWLNGESLSASGVQEKNKISEVKQLDFGKDHMLVLKDDGQVYSTGLGAEGQLGIGAKGITMERGDWSELYHVWPLEGTKIKQISCGGSHSAAVSECGDLYTWGRGFEGQTGLASKVLSVDHNDCISNIQLVPKLVSTFIKVPVKMVSCGHSHTGAVTMSGQVWMWGEGGSGQLGYGTRITRQTWPKMTLAACPKTGEGFATVSCGWAHTLALTLTGQAYSWGLNNYGQLGLSDHKKRWTPEAISLSPIGKEESDDDSSNNNNNDPGPIIDVQAVGNSSGALTLEGWVYTWGSSKHGKLNHGDDLPQPQPKLVKAFRGQYVTRFVLTDNNFYSFAPAQVRAISLGFDPLCGGSDIHIFGIGFFDSPHILVRFKPQGEGVARSAVGTFVSDRATGKRYIAAKTPKFPRPGLVTVEVSLNGKDFTFNGISYRCYRQPMITCVTPRFSHIRGGTALMLEGEHIFESQDVVVRFTDAAGNEYRVPGEVVPENNNHKNSSSLNSTNDTVEPGGEDEDVEDAYSGYITCVTPAFLSDLPCPLEVRVDVAMNGQCFEPVRAKHPFIYHNVTISSINPPIIPAEGMVGQLQILGASFFEGITGRVNIHYGEDNLNVKSSTFVVGCESTDRLKCKIPSTRYVLGRDDANTDLYEATLELLTAKEVLIQPFHFNYYNEPSWALSPERVPYQGGSLIRLTSCDRAIVPSATPLLRFASADGKWSQDVPGVVKTTQAPPRGEGEEARSTIYYVEAPAPALPDSMRVVSTPPTLIPVSLTVALNISCFSSQVFTLSYYDQPVLKEISPVEGLPGEVIILKGSLFPASSTVKVRLVGSDGTTLEAEAACDGEPAQATFTLPAPPALPFVVASIGIAMDGQIFTSQPTENGAKSTFKLTIQDPAKVKKKK